MNIQFILSDTTNGATSAALKDVINKAEADIFSNVLVLVPEPKSIAIERELLDYSKNGAFANVFVYSFVRLLSRIGKIDEQSVVSKQTCVMILRKIILENADKLLCYKKTAKTLGFAEKIYDTIEQFKSSSYTAKDVQNLAQNSSGALKSKMQDITFLFEEYEKALSDGLIDDCDRLRRLGELAKTSDFIKESDIFIVGFDNVTSDMLEVLKELAIQSKSITFSCVYFNEKRKDKYIQDNELYHKFTSIANKLKFPYVPKFANSSFKGDFWNIHNYLYSTENKQVPTNGNVLVFELENKLKEIDFVANQILSEVKGGKRFRDIAVIDADFEKDEELISRTFEEYNIPFYISKSYDISEHFLVRFIKNSIEVIVSKFSADKVLKWLANPLIDDYEFSSFENYVNEFGVNYSGFFNKPKENQIGSEEKRKSINLVVDFIKKFSDNFAEKFSGQKPISVFIEGINDLVKMANADEKIEQISLMQKKNGYDIEAEISLKILEKLNKFNGNLDKFLGNIVVSAQEFLQIFLFGFSVEEVNLVPVSVDCVFIQKNADGLYKIKDLFIVGAVEGSFPVKMIDTGILQDDELENSSKILQKNIEPKIKDINKREKFTCFEFMLLPSEKLFISYSSKSFGVINKPAEAVIKLKKLFNLNIQKSYFNNKFITQKIAEKQLSKHIGEFLSGEILSQNDINYEYNQLKSRLSFCFKDYLENLSFGNRDFTISKAREIYFLNNKTSVSQLESYFACPYKFFAKYGLRLKDNKNASLNSLDVGTIVHKFAENFTKNIDKFNGLNKEDFNKKAGEILLKSLDELQINKNKNIAVLSFISDEAIRLANYLYLEQEQSSFKNDYKLNEFEFYGNNAVKLQIDDNTVISIEGKIDRIDKFGDYIRIIDYKTGETDNSLNSIYYGKKIQLVSYLSACEKINGKKVAGLFYFPIHSDFVKIQQKMANNYKMRGFLLDNINVIKYMDSKLSLENNESNLIPLKIKNNKETRETGEFQISYGNSKNFLTSSEFEDLKNYTNELCAGAVREILDGNIEPSPLAKGTERESQECLYCELAGFCGREYAKFGKARRCNGEVTNKSFKTEE